MKKMLNNFFQEKLQKRRLWFHLGFMIFDTTFIGSRFDFPKCLCQKAENIGYYFLETPQCPGILMGRAFDGVFRCFPYFSKKYSNCTMLPSRLYDNAHDTLLHRSEKMYSDHNENFLSKARRRITGNRNFDYMEWKTKRRKVPRHCGSF